MNAASLKLLCENIQDFKAAALHMEREIRVQGLTHDPQIPLIDKLSWNYDPWISKKTVSLFNLGIALELVLKLLLIMYEREKPNEHSLTRLYDGLPRDVRDELERGYREELSKNLDVGCIVAFIDYKLPRPEQVPTRATPDISTLRGFFEYFDSDVSLSTKRYSWERVGEYSWNYYIDDISLFVNLIDRIMVSI